LRWAAIRKQWKLGKPRAMQQAKGSSKQRGQGLIKMNNEGDFRVRSSMPQIPVQRPVLDCFQDMRRPNIPAFSQIGNRARDLENAVVCPGA
jgi:hypothetical protein